MDFFRRLAQQLREVWAGMSGARRAVFLAVAALLAALVGGVLYYRSAQPTDWAVLYAHLTTDDAQAMHDKLQAQGVPVRVTADGTTVEVPADRVGPTRIDLAAQGLPATSKGYEIFDEPSISQTPFTQNVNLLRAKQTVLAKTIRQLDPVANASVEIARAEPSPFIRDKEPTTASVMVTLKPGASLSRAQVGGIVAFVSKAVEGLAPENVTVVDNRGNLISEPSGPEAGAVASQLDYRRAMEGYLAEKAQAILMPALGAGHAVVKVTADINFERLKEVRDTVNPEQKVVKTERTSVNKSTSGGGGARGVAGASSNLALRQVGAAAAAGGGTSSQSNDETTDTTYDFSRTHSELDHKLGNVTRLTVAATVDLTAPPGGQPPLTKQAVEGLIRGAVGIDEARGDSVQVIEAKLTTAVPPEAKPAEAEKPAEKEPEWWVRLGKDPQLLFTWVRNISLIVAAVVILLLGWLLIRSVRPPAPVPPPPPAPAPPPVVVAARESVVVDRLTAAAQRDPEAIARAIAALMEQP